MKFFGLRFNYSVTCFKFNMKAFETVFNKYIGKFNKVELSKQISVKNFKN